MRVPGDQNSLQRVDYLLADERAIVNALCLLLLFQRLAAALPSMPLLLADYRF